MQEYGSDCPPPNTNRVYISYLDSVRYFESQPTNRRTLVYHAVLVGYLQHVKSLGFTHAHIWVSPPKQGDDYIFYGHPDDMVTKRMGLLKLKMWYEQMLNTAKQRQVVADYQDMLEEFKGLESLSEIPLFSGDHWAASIQSKLKEESKKLVKQASHTSAGSTPTAGGPKAQRPVRARARSSARPPRPARPALARRAAPSPPPPPPPPSPAPLPSRPAWLQGTMTDMVDQLTEEMKSMRNHFIVVTLHTQHVGMSSGKCKPPTPDGLIHDPDGLLSNDLVDSRATLLEKCQARAACRARRGAELGAPRRTPHAAHPPRAALTAHRPRPRPPPRRAAPPRRAVLRAVSMLCGAGLPLAVQRGAQRAAFDDDAAVLPAQPAPQQAAPRRKGARRAGCAATLRPERDGANTTLAHAQN